MHAQDETGVVHDAHGRARRHLTQRHGGGGAGGEVRGYEDDHGLVGRPPQQHLRLGWG